MHAKVVAVVVVVAAAAAAVAVAVAEVVISLAHFYGSSLAFSVHTASVVWRITCTGIKRKG